MRAILMGVLGALLCSEAAAAGLVSAWGAPGYGGNDGVLDVPPGGDFIAIAAGAYHNLALRSDGSLAAWGSNDYGEGTAPGGTDFKAVACGQAHNVVLKEDGSIVAWGDNYYGQCTVPPGNEFVAVAGGFRHSLALTPEPAALGLVAAGLVAALTCHRAPRRKR